MNGIKLEHACKKRIGDIDRKPTYIKYEDEKGSELKIAKAEYLQMQIWPF
jgi:hypothetical protein